MLSTNSSEADSEVAQGKDKKFLLSKPGMDPAEQQLQDLGGGISGEGGLWCLPGTNPNCREVSKEECVIRGLLCCPVGSRLVENPFLQHRHQ